MWCKGLKRFQPLIKKHRIEKDPKILSINKL